MATRKAKQDLATTTDVNFTDDRPEWMNKDSSRGQEGVTAEDLTIPRLELCQALSPQLSKNKPEYIEGIEVGDLFNSVSNKVYGTEVTFVPVFFRKEWVIWKDRKKGGGFRGAYSSPAEAEAALAELDDGADCEITDMAQHFGMIVTDTGTEDVVISMSKSKMKVSRQWNTIINMGGGDRFSRAYKLSSTEDTNANNEEYQNFKVSGMGYVTEELYNAGIKLYEALADGTRDVNRGGDGEAADNSKAEY